MRCTVADGERFAAGRLSFSTTIVAEQMLGGAQGEATRMPPAARDTA